MKRLEQSREAVANGSTVKTYLLKKDKLYKMYCLNRITYVKSKN
jgi:hypothetical protein